MFLVYRAPRCLNKVKYKLNVNLNNNITYYVIIKLNIEFFS